MEEINQAESDTAEYFANATQFVDYANLVSVLTKLANAIKDNEYMKACQLADNLHAAVGGSDITTAIACVNQTQLAKDVKAKLCLLIGSYVPEAVYQFSGNVESRRYRPQHIEQAIREIGELVPLLR